MDNSTAFVAERAACAASQASGELYNLYKYYYWSLPVASAHLDASAIPLPSQYNRCWHRKFNLDILVMMKVVVIGLNWAWQECDIATVGHYSMSTTLNYTAGGTQPAAYLPRGTEENYLFEKELHVYFPKWNTKNTVVINKHQCICGFKLLNYKSCTLELFIDLF